MSILNVDLYDALKEAGAGEGTARKAAASVAAYDNRFAKLESDLAMLKWMVGTNIAITFAICLPTLWLLLRVAAKTGALS